MEAWPFKSKEDAILDVKPLRSMAPIVPATHEFTTLLTPSSAAPCASVNPSGVPSSLILESPATSSYDWASASPFFQVQCATNISTIKLHDAPEQSGHASSSGKKIKRPGNLSHDSESKKSPQRKRPQKITNLSFVLPSTPDPKEYVEGVLMAFDAIRRRLLQLEEMTDASKRADLKAGAIMMVNDLRANASKRIGRVPGVDVGDIFYFRIEMCLVGLHAQSMAGIDYLNTKHGDKEELVATSIVSSGGYENEEGDTNSLIYTGQGGGTGNKYAAKKQLDNQKLVRGNLALERSLHRGSLIRVIRSANDANFIAFRIYIYDGLYKIRESWTEKGKSGFNIFKYKLFREPGQPEGFALWKRIEQWIARPSLRCGIILPDISSGLENLPVCLVNEVDNAKELDHFTYTTAVKYMNPVRTMRPLQGCRCLSLCLPGDANCSCGQQNNGNLPYNSSGVLVSRKTVIYECNSSCFCSVNCRNRLSQKGINLHFEVFRTRKRGWGLRSWDSIRAGTFLFEYTGEVTDKIKVADDEDGMYNFRAAYVDEKTLRWNHGPELLGEPSTNWREKFKPLPIIISAKNMGNIARFMNHSCSPNVFWQPVMYDHSDEGYPHIMFFANKHIPPMAELTFDYGVSSCWVGFDNFAGTWGPKKCLCGSAMCRGLFG